MFGRPKNEVELLQASLSGSPQAFGVLVGRYQSLVCAITYSATGSVEKSEELAQETFLRAWKSLRQLQDLSKFRAWLSSIARSTVQNWYRSQKRDLVGRAAPLDEAAEKASSESGPEEAAMIQEQQAVVRSALAQIPEALREPLVLFYREQKSVREVARQLGLSEAAARQRVSRGRGLLREQVADIVEATIARTGPGKAFTTAVIAAIVGMAIEGSTAAAATATAGGTLRLAALMSGLTAKIVAVAAGVVVIAGGVILFRQTVKTPQPPSEPAVAPSAQQEDTRAESAIAPTAQPQAAAAATADAVPALPPDTETTALSDAEAKDASPAPGTVRQTTAGEGQTKPFEFKARGVVSGLITDIATGEPVQDARVLLTKVGTRIVYARTDANGFYCFEEIPEAGNFNISIVSNAYVGISREQRDAVVHLSVDRQTVKHFQLPKACMVDVWVADANGIGIAGADVVATSLGEQFGRGINDSIWLRRTDPNGYILLGGFPASPTEYLITAWHRAETGSQEPDVRYAARTRYDYAPGKAIVQLTDPNIVKQVQIVLERGQSVPGYIEYADGVPVTGIEVAATPTWWHSTSCVDLNKVGANGRFLLEHILPGPYEISIFTPTGDSAKSSRSVMQVQLPPPGREPLIVRLPGRSPQSLASISGSFTFRGEKKPGHIEISVASSNSSRIAYVERKANGEAADTFTIDRLEPGIYTLRFSGDVEEKVIENIAAPSAGLQVELTYGTMPRLTGRVVDARTGEPVQDFRIRAKELRSLRGSNRVLQNKWIRFENERGEFGLETVGPGVYRVQAVADGYAPTDSAESNTDKPEGMVVKLSAGGGIAGRVVNESGEPVNGAKVVPLSLAGGVMPKTAGVFAGEEGAVETVGGVFTLRHLPAGRETLKITHPDYTCNTVEGISVVEGRMTEGIEIILSRGGTVEGYVYDAKGVRQAGVMLCFQDQGGYLGVGDEEAGRLGTAVTDANGFYRIAHLPQQLCYVKRANEWRSLGVTRRLIVPRKGEVLRLDFGGTPVVSGAVVLEGVPLTKGRLVLSPSGSAYDETFTCYATTDEHGGFAFGGPPPGTYALCAERPEKRNQWEKLATVTVADTDVAVGAIPTGVSRVLVTVDNSGGGTPWEIAQVLLEEAARASAFAVPLHTAEAPAAPGGPWVLRNVAPGQYTLTVLRRDYVWWRTEIELASGASPWEVSLTLPSSEARLSGHTNADTTPGLAIWCREQSILALLLAPQGGAYRVKDLPAGRYFVSPVSRFLYDMPPLTEFSLQAGEDKVLDLDLSAQSENRGGYLVVHAADETGQVCRDARVRLEGSAGVVEPTRSAGGAHAFRVPAGEYLVRAENPGYRSEDKRVTVKALVPGEGTPQSIVICLERK